MLENGFIGEDEIIDLPVDLVRIPSINPPADTRECSEFILRKQLVSAIPIFQSIFHKRLN